MLVNCSYHFPCSGILIPVFLQCSRINNPIEFETLRHSRSDALRIAYFRYRM